MSKPDWKGAPYWANYLLQQNQTFCWAESISDGSKALLTDEKEGRDNFKLMPCFWVICEQRPC